jgi:hypothetical protein
MINALVEVVSEGQPLSVVVAHNFHYLEQLRKRVHSAFVEAGLPVYVERGGLVVDGSFIDFVTYSRLDEWRRGRSVHGEFIDHWVDLQ